MDENAYASPEPVTDFPCFVPDAEQRKRLRLTQTGLGLILAAVCVDIGCVVMPIMLIVFGLQMAGTIYCWEGLPEAVRGGRWLAVLAWMVCGVGMIVYALSGWRNEHIGLLIIVASRVPWLGFLITVAARLRDHRALRLGLAAVVPWLIAGVGGVAFDYVEFQKGYLSPGEEWLVPIHGMALWASPLALLVFWLMYVALLVLLRARVGALLLNVSEGERNE